MSLTVVRVAMMAAHCAAPSQTAALAAMPAVHSAALNQIAARVVTMAVRLAAVRGVQVMAAKTVAQRAGVTVEVSLDDFRSADAHRAEDSSCASRGAQHYYCCRCFDRRLNFASAAVAARPVDNRVAGPGRQRAVYPAAWSLGW